MCGPYFYFLAIGPAVGTFGFVAVDQLLDVAGFAVSSLAHTGTPIAIFGTIPLLWLYGVIFAYPIGLLPALLSATLYTRTIRSRAHLHGPMRGLIGGISGLLVATLFGGVLFHRPGTDLSVLVLAPWAVAGALGGFASGMLHRPVEPAARSRPFLFSP